MRIAEITVDELEPLLQAGAVMVDVREPSELAEVRVRGVIAIPLGELTGRLAEIPVSDIVYVICRSGVRSLTACEHLQAAGREAVNVSGGTLAWVASGRPTESGPMDNPW